LHLYTSTICLFLPARVRIFNHYYRLKRVMKRKKNKRRKKRKLTCKLVRLVVLQERGREG
jgi:hypothetical protein